MSRFRFIAAEKAGYPVVRLCRVLKVSASGFYAWAKRPPSARAVANAGLTERIRAAHVRSRSTYGSARVHADLRETEPVGRKRVARLMREAGLVGCRPRGFHRTTIADPTVQSDDLVRREFRPANLDQLWVSDITYVRTDEGWLYLAAILDACSRRVVGWSLADNHVRQSVGRPGTCWDNAVAESFFATLKTELIHRRPWPTRQRATTAIFGYIEAFYNRQR